MITYRQNFAALAVVLLLAPVSAYAQLAAYEVMYALSGDEGAGPQSGLVRGADDRLYGTATEGGGVDGAGTIFSISSPGGPLVIVHTFRTTDPTEGLYPVSLMRGRDKNLYGTTDYGGTAGDGIIYKLAWNEGTQTYSGVTVVHAFNCANGDGGDPWGTLIEGPDGALYGVTIPSWQPDLACTDVSTVFKVNTDGSGFQVLGRFDYLTDGSNQYGPLSIGADGSIYGTLSDSLNPANQYGSIYKISPQGDVTFLKVFTDSPDGAYPFSGVVRGPDGALYGTTYGGGANGVGTIFRITEAGAFSTLYSFEADSVHTPYSPLVVGGDGVIYGIGHDGGTGFGGSYIFDPASGFTVHELFDDVVTGSYAYGVLGVGADRHLYGTQSSGGAGGQGVLFGLGDIEVANRPPFAVALASPNPAEALGVDGATVALSALGSWDPDFDDLTYSWDLPSQAGNVDEAADSSTVTATFPEGTWPVTLTVSDGISTRSVTIQVEVLDAPPLFTPVSPISVPATSPLGAVVTYAEPTATDLIDGVREVTCSPVSGLLFPQGPTTVVCTASDLTGHTGTTSFVVSVTAAVLITAPGNLTVEATSASGASVPFLVSATSALGAPLPVVCSTPSGVVLSGATFTIGQTPVDCSAIDTDTDLEAFASFIVTVRDTTGPTITMDINGIEFNAQGPFGAVIDYSSTVQPGMVAEDVPSAYDLVDGNVSIVCNPPPGSTFPLGDANATMVTCTAEDSRGNGSTFVFYVIVRDSDFPVLTVPGPIVAEATGPGGRQVTFTTTATDISSPVGIVTTCSDLSGAMFPLGATTVTCQAKDVSNLLSPIESFVITIVDTTAPVFAGVPGAITIPSTSPAGAVVLYALPTAFDLVNGVMPVSCGPASGSTFPVGTTSVVCTASDLNSPTANSATATFNVIVTDGVKPVVTVPGTITTEATASNGATVTFIPAPTALDDRDGVLSVTCVPSSGSTFAIGTTAVTCRATDLSGNEGVATFNVVVRDTIAPVLTVANIEAEATSSSGASVIFTQTAFDVVGVIGGISCTPASGSVFPLGVTPVSCTAQDAAGNTGAASFTVTVRDTIRPVITMPANISLQATTAAGAVAVFVPTVVEAVGPVSLVCTPASGSTFAIGTTSVLCVATDGSGNFSSGTLQVTVVDTAGPVITVPADMTVVAAGPSGTNVTFVTSAVDAVDGVRPFVCIPPSGSLFAVGPHTVSCSSSDSRGNVSHRSFTVTVVNTPPTLVVTLSPGVLWPPNHKMVTITATIGATSEVGPAPIVTLVSIKSSEPDNGLGDGDTANDIQGATYGTNDRVFQVRAERSGKGPGRVYTVTYKATHALNPSIFTIVTATVTVPSDMRDKKN